MTLLQTEGQMEEKGSQVVILGARLSPCCMRVEIALKLKGIPYKYMEEDLSNKSEFLLKSNPVKKVPVLLHNDKAICDSLVILEYIDETWNHTPKLLPHDLYQRAKIRFWVNYCEQNIIQAVISLSQSEGEERVKAIENLNELIGIFTDGMKKDFSEELASSNGKPLGLLDIAVGAFSGLFKAIPEAMEREVIHPLKNSQFLSWIDALNEHPLMKETMPPYDKLAAILREKIFRAN